VEHRDHAHPRERSNPIQTDTREAAAQPFVEGQAFAMRATARVALLLVTFRRALLGEAPDLRCGGAGHQDPGYGTTFRRLPVTKYPSAGMLGLGVHVAEGSCGYGHENTPFGQCSSSRKIMPV